MMREEPSFMRILGTSETWYFKKLRPSPVSPVSPVLSSFYTLVTYALCFKPILGLFAFSIACILPLSGINWLTKLFCSYSEDDAAFSADFHGNNSNHEVSAVFTYPADSEQYDVRAEIELKVYILIYLE